MNTVFETLAHGAVDHNSRKIAHRATRKQLFITGSENIELAQKQVGQLERVYQERQERYEWAVDRRKELRERLAVLEIAQELDGAKHGEEIGNIKSELDELDQAISGWSIVEPELASRIQKAQDGLAAFTKKAKRAEHDVLLNDEKKAGIELYAAFEKIVHQSAGLQAMVDRKHQLQAELGLSRDGIGDVLLPKIDGAALRSGDSNVVDQLLNRVKEILLVG